MRVNASRSSAVGCRRHAAYFTAVDAAFYATTRVNAARFFGRWCRRYSANFPAVGATFQTTARVNAVRLSAVGVALWCPFYCCWCHLLHYGEGKCCPFFGRWCRRCAAHFGAVGAAFYLTTTVNASRVSAVRVGAMLPICLLLVPPLTLCPG